MLERKTVHLRPFIMQPVVLQAHWQCPFIVLSDQIFHTPELAPRDFHIFKIKCRSHHKVFDGVGEHLIEKGKP